MKCTNPFAELWIYFIYEFRGMTGELKVINCKQFFLYCKYQILVSPTAYLYGYSYVWEWFTTEDIKTDFCKFSDIFVTLFILFYTEAQQS